MRVLGVDFGLRRIGLALSDPTGVLATPWKSVEVSTVRDAPGSVAAAALEAEAEAVVVGVPLGLEGEEARTEIRRVRRFAAALRKKLGIQVHLVDESMSTREAEELVSTPGARGRGPRRDARAGSHAVAAAIILQRWLDRPERRRKGSAP